MPSRSTISCEPEFLVCPRNARLNFRQLEPTHLMENVIYNELLHRGYAVDVGVVEHRVMKDGKSEYRQYEVDFIASAALNDVCFAAHLPPKTHCAAPGAAR